MSIEKCILGKIDAGLIDEDHGRRALDMLDELEAARAVDMPPAEARAAAARDMEGRLKHEARRKRDLAEKKIIAADRVRRQIFSHPDGPVDGALSMLGRDWHEKASWTNVEKQREMVRGRAHAMFSKGIQRFRTRKLGTSRDKAGEAAMVRELFGEATGDASASEIATAWEETAEYLRQRFNASGGDIAKLEEWRLPQTHDMRLLNETSAEEWKGFIRPLLDRDNIVDFDTGLPMSDEKLELMLSDIYETLRTDGLNGLTAGAQGSRALANRHQEHRVLKFRDGDSWLAYNRRFGSGDVFQTLTGHMDRMSSDIAWMEVMGPNPAHMRKYITDLIRKDALAKGGADAWDRMQGRMSKLNHFENVWDELSGRTSTPINARMAKNAAGVRSWLVASQLGSAFISATSDTWTNLMTAKFNGLSATGVMKNVLKLMTQEKDRTFAVQLGLLADGWTHLAGTAQRYSGEVLQEGFSGRLAEGVMRGSLLAPWTEAGQWAFGMEFLGAMARLSDTSFDQLPKSMQKAFGRYHIGADAWNLIRRAEMVDHDGARFMKPENIARQGTPEAVEAATALHRMILTERDYAVVASEARTRAMLQKGTQAGTASGEVARFFGMYKAFPITVLTTHLMRSLNQGSLAGKGAYAASLFIPLTVFGMGAYQAKKVIRGQDPVPMDPSTEEGRKAWVAAAMQGGGAGILGDFLFSDQNRFGGGAWATLGGPGADFLEETMKYTIGNVQEAAAGEDTHIGSETVRLLGRYVPGSSLWYGRLALERLVLDQLSLAVDPRARQRFRRIERRALREYGHEHWWHRGQKAPSRPPQLTE